VNRFSSLDLAAVSASLSKCVGMRVQNIYDLDKRTYLLKLAKPDHKQQLLIECGVRVHLTDFNREVRVEPECFSLSSLIKHSPQRPPVPSVFTMKLRKLLRTKRLESAEQQALDRCLILTFGSGDATVRLVLEFYAAGNIILTDQRFNILALIRSYDYELPAAASASSPAAAVAPRRDLDDDAPPVAADASGDSKPMGHVAVGEVYPLSLIKDLQSVSQAQFDAMCDRMQDAAPPPIEGNKKKAKAPSLRDLLNDSLEIGPRLVLHVVTKAGLTAKTPPSQLRDAAVRGQLFAALKEVEQMLLELKRGSRFLDGFIVMAADGTYESITPMLLAQHADRQTQRFETFNAACDEFFSRAEAMKVEKQRQAKLSAVERTLENVRQANAQRLDALIEKQRYSERAAILMQRHVDIVGQALAIVNSAVANHLDWSQLTQLVKDEKRRGNAVAQLIHELRLDKNEIVLMLYDDTDQGDGGDDDDDDDDEDGGDNDDDTDGEADTDDKVADADADEGGAASREKKQTNSKNDDAVDRHPVLVTLDLDLSAQANIGKLFEARRAAVEKHGRTLQSSKKALKSAERQAKADMAKVHIQAEVLAIRKRYWFEKFRWFISTDGVIVVGGQDAQQNELLVRRYLRSQDYFVHADMHGAATVVIRRPSSVPADAPMPAATVLQAGAFAVCHSSAWASKIVHGSWWVSADQVSKQAPAGEYLVAGGFMIRGKKNFIEPQPLQMGFGVLFVVDDDSVLRRRQRAAERAANANARGLAVSVDSGAGDGDDDDDDEGDVPETPMKQVKERKPAAAPAAAPAAVPVAGTTTAPPAADAAGAATDSDESSSSGDDDDMFRIALVTGEGGASAKTDDGATSAATDAAAGDEQAASSDKRVRMSARHRKLIKQGKDPHAPENQPKPRAKPSAAEQEAAAAEKVKNKPLPRGKKSKLRRMKEKYAEQDDEDRALARTLYGYKIPELPDKHGVTAKAASDEDDADEDDESGSEAKQKPAESAVVAPVQAAVAVPMIVAEKRCYVCGEVGHERSACPEREAAANVKHKKEIQDLLAEEGLAGGESAAAQSSDEAQIEALVGVPVEDDALLFALVCCAPWVVANKLKFKRKLVPGASKRGKAVKDCINSFVANEATASQRELALIKALDPAEMAGVMMGNASLVAAGAKKSGGGGGGGGNKGQKRAGPRSKRK
jgi:predicted ribosome quality control (RQC) complex YloA/Tae2 family protein